MENHRSEEEILTVKGLSVSFTQYDRGFGRKEIQAVTDLDLRIRSGRSWPWWVPADRERVC
ncbi:MAG: hypothetical protein ACLU8D_08480 [Enterocloster sp.]